MCNCRAYGGHGSGGAAVQSERLVKMSLIAGGAGVLILFCVLGRAMFQAARRREISPFEESDPGCLAAFELDGQRLADLVGARGIWPAADDVTARGHVAEHDLIGGIDAGRAAPGADD